MYFKLYIIFIILIMNWDYIKSNGLSEVKLIKSYVERQNFPVQVTFYSCWRRRQILTLLQELTRIKIFATVVTNFSKIMELEPVPYTLIISDSSCAQLKFLLDMAENSKLFRSPYKWLILNNDTTNNPIPFTSKILIDSNFAVATKDSSDEYHLKLIYKYTEHQTSFVYNDLGKFANTFSYYNSFSTVKNRSNLMGSTLTVSYVLTNPDSLIDSADYRNCHIDGASKLSYILVLDMLETLNCSKNFILRQSWGYQSQNSTYYDGGMIGDLQNGTAEIGGTVAFYSIDRLDVIEYVSITTPSDLKFILRAPPLSYVKNIFTLPFEVNVWYSLYVVIGLAILILYVIVIYERRYGNIFDKQNNINNLEPKLLDVILVQIGAISQQGSDVEPKSVSGRMTAFIIFLATMFMYTSYSGNIVVLLQSKSSNVWTIHDLLDSQISLGVDDIIYSKHYFEVQEEPIRKAIYEKKIIHKPENPNFMSVEDGVEKMRNQYFGFHVETSFAYKVVMDTFQEHEKCGLIEVDYLNALWPSLSVRKHSSYKEPVKVGFRKIQESGIRHRHVNRIYFKKPECSRKGGSFTSVGMIDAYFPFAIFGAGVFLSVMMLLTEVLFRKYYHLRRINASWKKNKKFLK